ncbi:hypothetical protein [Rhodohalobacter sp. 614A]|uniref:hypothetical protein n=1 Tax=Rhodohalobacter sp. 614A TaxID=2908649 RepID=UPI001F47F9A3|nr:hypothetical protein [Rhodohalobacter sp. 614A]
MKSIFLYLLLMICTACQSSLTPEQYDYGDEFDLAIGEKTRIGDNRISVEFVDVLEDSRCPSNANCIWAGNGKVQLKVQNHDIILNTYLEPHDTTITNIHVELLNLAPYPEYPRQFEKDDYYIRLLITKK